MHTIFDWVTMLVFGALATLFLHRSIGTRIRGDHAWKYLPAALGCVAIDMVGNAGQRLLAILLLIVVVAYGMAVLKPWTRDL